MKMNSFEAAVAIRKIYAPKCEFPEWVLELKNWSKHDFQGTVAYYHREDSLEDVQLLLREREPCNITMHRLYNKEALQQQFGYSVGAYSRSTKDKLMPNIAVYCNATVKVSAGFRKTHVINLVGAALDTSEQPDYAYFHNQKAKLIKHYTQMWQLAFACAKELHATGKITKMKIYNVGGGAFAGWYGSQFITEIFEPSFLPLLPCFPVGVYGYDRTHKRFIGGIIPDIFDDDDEGEDMENSLYVNAWDPWSLIGNGNETDSSLDGYWGRISNMAVLGWSVTNPQIQTRSV